MTASLLVENDSEVERILLDYITEEEVKIRKVTRTDRDTQQVPLAMTTTQTARRPDRRIPVRYRAHFI